MLFDMITRFLSLSLGLAMFLLVFSGCAPAGIPVVPVQGTVLFEGEPIDRALVTFVPVSEGRNTAGITDSNGRFSMITPGAKKSGCMPGEYKVMITKKQVVDSRGRPVEASPVLVENNRGPLYKEKTFLPDKYGNIETSGLEAKVKSRGGNRFVFDLVNRMPE